MSEDEALKFIETKISDIRNKKDPYDKLGEMNKLVEVAKDLQWQFVNEALKKK